MRKRLVLLGGFLCVVLAGGQMAFGADYPNRAITLINPMAPGGTLDIQSRAYATVVEKYLGQPVVVVNKPGAIGMIGGLAGAQAAPDGYTLTVGSVNMTNAIEWEIANGRTPPFTRGDFISLGCFSLSPNLLAVHFESSWKTLGDFVKDVRGKPNQYAFSSGGLYGMSHLPVEIFARAAGLKFRHVPYSGGGPALAALVGKHVDFNAPAPSTGLPLMRGNKVRVLAVLGDKRLKMIPAVPTAKELGFDAEYFMWVGVMVPKKTPPPLVERLREATRKAVEDKAFVEMMEKTGEEVQFIGGEGFGKFWEAETEKIGKLMRELVKEAAAK
jgi:tripartite-type tricarboxylate transporter receptor subunit TctC